ncbi:MAG: diacylglycerol kinase family protein [Mobilitalea sp.]
MYYFIVNPQSSSGLGIKEWNIVKEELEKQNVLYQAFFTEYMGHAIKIAKQICTENEGIKNIVVLGGDGTINEVINGIDRYSEVLLGYIPSGSSNDLARSLNIPREPLEALSHILKPTKFKYLDHGIMSFPGLDLAPRKFSCSSGIGYDANVCNEVQSSPLKKSLNRFHLGKFVYYLITIKQIVTLKRMSATVIVDGARKESYEGFIFACNMIHKYEGGGLMMAPDADPTDGKLSICLVHGLNMLRCFMLLPTIIKGTHVKHKGVETFNCSEIEIITEDATSIHTDGEIPAVYSHIKVSCLPEQMRMIL